MKDLTFYDGWPDSEALYEYEPTLFHLPAHLKLQQSTGWQYFYAFDDRRKRVVASLPVHIEQRKAATAVRSPFGNIECASSITPEGLYEFIRFIDAALPKLADEAEIRMSPEAYVPRIHTWMYSFLHAVGYRTTQVDLSSCIAVSDNFAGIMRKTESQVMHKALHAGLTASLMPADRMHEAYSFIVLHHKHKDYGISMTWPQLERTAALFPDRYLAFGVHAGQALVAAAIAIRVSTRVLSLFYIDHDSQFDKLSPPVLLIAALHDYCSVNRIPLLDLGTSSLPAGPNIGLLSFKLRMGATASMKPTLRKVYHA